MSTIGRAEISRQIVRRAHPGVVIVIAFAALAGIGAVLLTLPATHREGAAVSGMDAFFTSVSAVTVTGLAVQDTSTTWNHFGLLVILVLIQIGGLGIMTIAGFLGLVVSHRLTVRASILAGTEIGYNKLGPLGDLVWGLVRFVAISELLLAAALSARFIIEDKTSTSEAIFNGVFHAVSAFNNAGFSSIDGGLSGYVTDWFVSIVIAAGFIIGGIGFPVIFELRKKWRTPRFWSLHSKVSLSCTAVLLVGGTGMVALLEWTNPTTIGELRYADRLLASFFQAATTRTAGFNTVPIESLRPATWIFFILLMVIGANSASTAGGIKTSTVAVALAAAYGQLRGDKDVNMFEKRIPTEIRQQSLALVIAALGVVGTATFLLAIFEPNVPPMRLLFESASAFGTAGLSAAVTPTLGGAGRIIIVVLMFVGRVGPITFGTAFLFRPESQRYRFPEDDLMVG